MSRKIPEKHSFYMEDNHNYYDYCKKNIKRIVEPKWFSYKKVLELFTLHSLSIP